MLEEALYPSKLWLHIENMYQRHYSWGILRRSIARSFGRSNWLYNLHKSPRQVSQNYRRYIGFQTFPIAKIEGSENRPQDFDRDFKSLQEHTCFRGVSIAQARMAGIEMPPVELILQGDTYYVRDGHHRTSVARALGEEFIDSDVTEW